MRAECRFCGAWPTSPAPLVCWPCYGSARQHDGWLAAYHRESPGLPLLVASYGDAPHWLTFDFATGTIDNEWDMEDLSFFAGWLHMAYLGSPTHAADYLMFSPISRAGFCWLLTQSLPGKWESSTDRSLQACFDVLPLPPLWRADHWEPFSVHATVSLWTFAMALDILLPDVPLREAVPLLVAGLRARPFYLPDDPARGA